MKKSFHLGEAFLCNLIKILLKDYAFLARFALLAMHAARHKLKKKRLARVKCLASHNI